MNLKKVITTTVVCSLLFAWALPVNTAMTGGDFEIYADAFNVVSTVSSTGGIFTLYDTMGEFGVATSTGNTFTLSAGFQALNKGILSFTQSASSIDLGALTKMAVNSANVVLTVTTDSETGYAISMTEDGDLRSGVNIIDDVADGSVTMDKEEYGITMTGTGALFSDDRAITNGLAIVSTSGSAIRSQSTAIFKASVISVTPVGDYSHNVTFTLTVNP
ncbi:MAG: hypothetical protein CO137_02810 [Candidatus Magasanikbacteria bacterium CG_4_9_14_3_um_filter_32_9]|uniref:WxL domain-containing protein n=1 Tax=Candidatus Magasanikbacteria bacterium CG_4_9_14_3_um_filter_32_9 TaxID=1974644 RepID=A0A2M7Z6E5_9BACT|nr:MAG: hypothetical protein CO137_02810 [Candidatus Magasanikbacteria bacterium CG_4_9_14_3_um_filter_32_9]